MICDDHSMQMTNLIEAGKKLFRKKKKGDHNDLK